VVVQVPGFGVLSAEFSTSPTDPVSGQLVSFNGNLSSPQASIVSYDWDFGDGTIVNGQPSFIINHTYFTPTGNNYNIRLTVHDNLGRVATVVHSLSVGLTGSPVARFTVSPSPAPVNTAVAFDGSASSPGARPIVSYTWDFGDGSPVITTGIATTSHTYTTATTRVIRLTVTDSGGLTGSTTRTLVVQ
jgi:PKD repeat protein